MTNKQKRKQVLLTTLICCLLALAARAQEEPMDIKKAIDIALANNRSLRSDSLNISISGSKKKEIAGLFLPQVNYSTVMEYNPAIASQLLPGTMVGQPAKTYVPVQFGTRYNLRSGVEVTQAVYRKDLKLQVNEAGLQTKVAATRYSISREELVYQVATRYYSLQINAEMIRTTRFDYHNMEEILGIAKAQYENGVLKRIDYQSLQINVANLLSQLNQLQTEYGEQLAYFNYLLGIPAETATTISNNISGDLHKIDGSFDIQQRNDIRLFGEQIRVKENELKRIAAEKSPAINSYFRYNIQSQFNSAGNAFDKDYRYNSSTLGVALSIPLFDGNRRKNRSQAVITELEQLKLNSKQKQEQAKMEVISAKATFNNNLEEYGITKRNEELAATLFNSRKALYTEGVTTLLELLDAERELSKARNNRIQALINVHTGWLDLHKAKGTLLTDFVKSI